MRLFSLFNHLLLLEWLGCCIFCSPGRRASFLSLLLWSSVPEGWALLVSWLSRVIIAYYIFFGFCFFPFFALYFGLFFWGGGLNFVLFIILSLLLREKKYIIYLLVFICITSTDFFSIHVHSIIFIIRSYWQNYKSFQRLAPSAFFLYTFFLFFLFSRECFA